MNQHDNPYCADDVAVALQTLQDYLRAAMQPGHFDYNAESFGYANGIRRACAILKGESKEEVPPMEKPEHYKQDLYAPDTIVRPVVEMSRREYWAGKFLAAMCSNPDLETVSNARANLVDRAVALSTTFIERMDEELGHGPVEIEVPE